MQVALPEPGTPTERMAPGGTATITLGNHPGADAFIREDMPHNIEMTNPEPATLAERPGTATINLGDNNPGADAFFREPMPQNTKMTLPEQPLATQRMAPGGTSTIVLGGDQKVSDSKEDSENNPNIINRFTVPADTKSQKVLAANTGMSTQRAPPGGTSMVILG